MGAEVRLGDICNFSLRWLFVPETAAPFIALHASSLSRAGHVKNTIIIVIHLHLTRDEAEGRKSLWLMDG